MHQKSSVSIILEPSKAGHSWSRLYSLVRKYLHYGYHCDDRKPFVHEWKCLVIRLIYDVFSAFQYTSLEIWKLQPIMHQMVHSLNFIETQFVQLRSTILHFHFQLFPIHWTSNPVKQNLQLNSKMQQNKLFKYQRYFIFFSAFQWKNSYWTNVWLQNDMCCLGIRIKIEFRTCQHISSSWKLIFFFFFKNNSFCIENKKYIFFNS